MKVKLNRKEFVCALSKITQVCKKRGTFAALACCLFEAKDGMVTVSATDLESTISIDLYDVEVSEEGTRCINTEMLNSTLRTLTAQEVIIDSAKDSVVKIYTEDKSANLRINAIDVSEYPEIKFERKGFEWQKVSAKELYEAISKVDAAISNDTTRVEFTGAEMMWNNNGFQLVATDGRRLHVYESSEYKRGYSDSRTIIPHGALKIIGESLSDNINKEIDGTIEIGLLGGGKLLCNMSGLRFSAVVISGMFPDFRAVIPSNSPICCVVNSGLLSDALRTVRTVKNKVMSMRMSFEDKIVLTSENELSGCEVYVPYVNVLDRRTVIALNMDYLSDALKACACEEVRFELTDCDSPMIVRDEDENNKNLTCIIMPIQL